MIEVNRLYNTMLFKYGRDHTLEVFEHLSIVCYVLLLKKNVKMIRKKEKKKK